jgi:hypothetical protein
VGGARFASRRYLSGGITIRLVTGQTGASLEGGAGKAAFDRALVAPACSEARRASSRQGYIRTSRLEGGATKIGFKGQLSTLDYELFTDLLADSPYCAQQRSIRFGML